VFDHVPGRAHEGRQRHEDKGGPVRRMFLEELQLEGEEDPDQRGHQRRFPEGGSEVTRSRCDDGSSPLETVLDVMKATT
jgi:hypothetical protein